MSFRANIMVTDKLPLGQRIIAYMTAQKYRVDALNIVILEDSDANGVPIAGILDRFDDRLLVVKNDGTVALNVACTNEPGSYYTYKPMNPKGAARIALGQHLDCWAFGMHHKQHALVQCAPISVFRDANKDGTRVNDSKDTGMFAINIHTTGDAPGSCPSTIGRWSAGCTVVQSSTSFYNSFMPLLRYSGRKVFSATFIDPKDL